MALYCARATLITSVSCWSCRRLHAASVLNGTKKTLLMKFATKNKKKFWYPGTSLGSKLMFKPPNFLESPKILKQKTKKEDSIRMRALNVILNKALTDLLDSCEVSQEIYDLRLEVTKVSLAGDFSACRVYWKTSGDAPKDDHTEKLLLKSAAKIRHLLITNQVMGNVPPVVFVKDRENAAIVEIEKLLAVADFGPEEADEQLLEVADFGPGAAGDFMSHQRALSNDPSALSSSNPNPSNLFGVDHEELYKQIAEYKERNQQKETEPARFAISEVMDQLSELKKQKVMRRKMKERNRYIYDDDVTPQKYLLNKYSEGDMDNASYQEDGLEYDFQEDLEELEAQDIDLTKETEKGQGTKPRVETKNVG